MDPFDEIVIKKYLSLSSNIERLLRYKKRMRQEFYMQNMTTHTEYTKLGVATRGFHPDKEIEKLHVRLDVIDRRIERYLFREKHFLLFWSTLTTLERYSLGEGFKHHEPIVCPQLIVGKVLDEINEIETALCFRDGIEPDLFENEIFDDVEENLERMWDFFAL